jgi:HTH-type transcriptional regulator, sugar sensing transcriptional regulator
MKGMDNLNEPFEKLGLSPKEVSVYVTLLKLGPTAIRKVAEESGVNRGSVYEALKKLQQEGLVSYFHKGKRQHFVAEDPKTLGKIFARKRQEIGDAEKELEAIIPHLTSLVKKTSDGPIVKFYEDYSGIRSILEDVLDSVSVLKEKKYVVFSSSAISPYLYNKNAFPSFTDMRIKKKIFVCTIASGKGGSTQGKDERKWLTQEDASPTYKLIYAGKVAMISIGEKNVPHGLIIEDEALYNTELAIFNKLWNTL